MKRLVLLALLAVPAGCNTGGGGSGGGNPPTPPPGTTITLTVTGNAPAAAAMQTGSGSWSKLTMTGQSGSFTLPSGTGTYGVAIVCDTLFEFIEELTVSDTKSPTIFCPQTGTMTPTVSYNLANIPLATHATVYVNSISGSGNTVSGSVPFTGAPSGAQDISVIAYANAGTDALAVKIARAVNVSNGLIGPITPVNGVDTTGTSALALSPPPLGYTTQVNAWYNTQAGALIEIKNAGSTASYPAVAAADSITGDYYYLQAFATQTNGTNLSQVGESQTFTSPLAASMTFPAPMTYAAPTPAQYPTFVTPAYSGFTASGTTTFQFGAFAPMQNEIVVGTSATYLAAVGNSFVFPNLSGVTGFLHEPASGLAEDWFAQETVESAPGNYLAQTPLPNNDTLQYALVSGQYTVP